MKKRIVIADDDPDILFTLQIMLENAGYVVEVSANGTSILDGKHHLPDLYILDKRMPDIDGLDLCRQLRGQPDTREIPIIIISASPKFGPQALVAGANDFLKKPFQMKALLKMAEKYVGIEQTPG